MIRKIVSTIYRDEGKGFDFTFEPLEDSIIIEKQRRNKC